MGVFSGLHLAVCQALLPCKHTGRHVRWQARLKLTREHAHTLLLPPLLRVVQLCARVQDFTQRLQLTKGSAQRGLCAVGRFCLRHGFCQGAECLELRRGETNNEGWKSG